MQQATPQDIRRLKRRRRLLIRRLVLMCILSFGLLLYLWPKFFPEWKAPSLINRHPVSSNTVSGAGSIKDGPPDFTVLTPDNTPARSLRGKTLTPPNNSSSFFSFNDTVNGVYLKVSEQPLPEALKDPGEDPIQGLAQGYNANRSITAGGDTTVYIGTSSKGYQSIIFVKEGLLITIVSTAALNDDQWIQYIDSLR